MLSRAAEKLVEYNVLYPCRRGGEESYLPQLPIYAAAIKAAAEKGYTRTSQIPAETLKKIVEDNPWSRVRCS